MRTVTRTLRILVVVCALGLTACAGGGASRPAVPAQVAQSAPASMHFELTREPSSATLPAVGGFAARIAFPGVDLNPEPSVTIDAAAGTFDTGATLQTLRRTNSGTLTVLFSVAITPPVDITFSSVPGFAFDIPASFPTAGRQFFVALSDPTVTGVRQFNTEGPGSVSGQHVSFDAMAQPLTLLANKRYIFALYATSAAQLVYVLAGQSIVALAADASGDASPVRTITGPHTGLVDPGGIAVDAAGRLYVISTTFNFSEPLPLSRSIISVFEAGADGDASPIASFTFGGAGMNVAQALTVNQAGTEVTVAAFTTRPRADTNFVETLNGSGTILRDLTGAPGTFNAPCPLPSEQCPSLTLANGHFAGLARDNAGNLLVGFVETPPLSSAPTLNTTWQFAPAASGTDQPAATVASTPVSADGTTMRTLAFLPGTNEVAELRTDSGRSLVAVFRDGPGNVGTRTISGVATTFDGSESSLAADVAGSVFVSHGRTSILAFGPGSSGNVAPSRVIGGPHTGLTSIIGIAVGPP